MRTLPFLFTLIACGPGLAPYGAYRDAPPQGGQGGGVASDPPTDPGVDSGSETESDKPVESDPEPSDPSPPPDPITDGTYRGTVNLNLESSGLTGTCNGPATVTVNRSSRPAIQGTATCEVDGSISFFLEGPYSGTLTGDITTTPNAAGEITIDALLPTSARWTGFFASSGRLQGHIEGVSGSPPLYVAIDGTFSVRPD